MVSRTVSLLLESSKGCLLCRLPAVPDAARITSWTHENVSELELASDGYENDCHTTVAYGFSSDVTPEEVSAVVQRAAPEGVDLRLGTVSFFTDNPEHDVLKVDVESQGMDALHQALRAAFGARLEVTFDQFHPHLTLAYVRKGACGQLEGNATFAGWAFRCPTFVYSTPGMSSNYVLPMALPTAPLPDLIPAAPRAAAELAKPSEPVAPQPSPAPVGVAEGAEGLSEKDYEAPMNESESSLYAELKAAGIEISNHESDLYFPDTPESRAILDRFPMEKRSATRFTNQAPPNVGQRWIDVPFAYVPWWEQRQGGGQVMRESKRLVDVLLEDDDEVEDLEPDLEAGRDEEDEEREAYDEMRQDLEGGDCYAITDKPFHGYHVSAPGGKHLGEFTEMGEAIQAILADMEESRYWPNVYFINDHGNVDLLSLNHEDGSHKIVQSWV
jgi:2'-5' RNA ligase superfamily